MDLRNVNLKNRASDFFKKLQDEICTAVEGADGASEFQPDFWERTDTVSGKPGGGGHTRILRKGAVFEQAGVNFSEVQGLLPDLMRQKLGITIDTDTAAEFYATGVSLVIHPYSPCVPTVHANFRYFEVGNIAWFGGGADLTPYILKEDDARHFHLTLKQACDLFSPEYYPRFKAGCDSYFFIPHRKESRGVGGVFFDYLGKDDSEEIPHYFEFTKGVGSSFIDSYIPIVEKRKKEKWSERQKKFQLLRRGRYVEFNLVYDRGTQFGLATGGRTESILMSIPPEAHWQYEGDISLNEEEQKLQKVLQFPENWV